MGLVLSRRVGESISIGEQIKITVERSSGGTAQLNIEAPRDLKVLRTELAAHRVDQVDPFTVRADLNWLHVFFGVERKEVNAQRFTWNVNTLAKDQALRPMIRFEWEWDERGQWLKLCNRSQLNNLPHLVARWDRPTRGEVERVCRALGMAVRGVRKAEGVEGKSEVAE
jgi:carbon storage regulator